MIKEHEMEVWLKAYCAFIESGHGYSDVDSITRSATLTADACVAAYKERFYK
jgi:hypothetical protein